jgi:hypothetical protein
MSTKFQRSGNAAPAAAADTPTPTPTHHQQLAAAFIKGLEDLGATVPQLEIGHNNTRRFVRTHSGYSITFLRTTVSAVEQSQELQAVKKLDPQEGRDALQFIDAFLPVLDAIETLRASLRFTIDARKANLAADCLQIMAIARGISRDPSSAAVGAHLVVMQRDLGRKRRKSAAEEPKPPEGAPKTGMSEPRANAARTGSETPVAG